MAARAIVGERRSKAILAIKEHTAAITSALGLDALPLDEHVAGGDEPYKEMVRTEQLAELLGAVREKVAAPPVAESPVTVPREAVSGTPPVDIQSIARIQEGDRKPGRKSHK